MSLQAETIVYFGTNTGDDSRGIYFSTLDSKTGDLSQPELAAEVNHPNFLAIHPSGERLYSVSSMRGSDGKNVGSVSSFDIQKDGSLRLINEQPSNGSGPCHISFDTSGRVLMVANYGSGDATSYWINDDGSISPPVTTVKHEGSSVNKDRQSEPHAHSVISGPSGKRAYVTDLGIDQIRIYEIDARSGALSPNSPDSVSLKPGGGPRHLAFHPSQNFAYVNLELSSQVTALKHDPGSGALTPLQTLSTLPETSNGIDNSTAETLVHPSGKFLYVSNRGHDSIAIYQIDERSGELTFAGSESTRGQTPRNFGIDPSGSFLIAANQNSHNVVVFRISPESGLLEPTGGEIQVPSPVCVRFLDR